MVQKFEQYPSSPASSRPSGMVPSEITDAWYRDWARYIYTMWKDGRCLVGPTGYQYAASETIATQRAYARGQQDIEKYRGILDKQVKLDDNSNARLLNISWRVPHILPVYRERIIDRIMEMRFEPSVIAIDEPSIAKKELMYFRDKLAATPEMQGLMQAAGQVPDNITANAMMMSQEELDQYRALGGYSLSAEIALVEATQATIDLCKFFPSIYRQVLGDLFDTGLSHVEIRHNPGDRMQIVDYIDPEFAIIPQSQYDDCRDVTWGGYLKQMSITAIRAESGFDEDTMLKIAKAYGPYMSNGGFSDNSWYGKRERFAAGNAPYDRFSAMVMTAYFMASEAESFIAGIHASGSKVMDPVKPGTTLSPAAAGKGFSIVNSTKQNIYKVKWIVGTDFVYATGVNDVVTREGSPGNMMAQFPIVTYRTNQPSVVDACISVVDDLCINIYKKRHIISKMPPMPNIAVNVSALEQATSLGNMRLMPQDLIDVYTVRGVLFLAGDQDFGEPFQNGTPPKPIIEMPNTALDQLRAIQIDLEMNMNELRAVTGANEISDGSGVKSGLLNGVADSFNQSSNRALSWLYTANESIQTQIYTQLAKRYQAVASTGDMKIKYLPIGADTVHIVNLSEDISLSDFMIIVKPGVDEMTKQALIASVSTYKQGQQISPADEMAVITMISRGQYRKAQFYLATAVTRKAKQDMLLAQSNAQAQAQAQGQVAVALEQEKQKTMQGEGAVKSELLKLEYELKNQFEEQQVGREIRKATGSGISGALVDQAVQPAA